MAIKWKTFRNEGKNNITMRGGWICRWVDLFIIELLYVEIYTAQVTRNKLQREKSRIWEELNIGHSKICTDSDFHLDRPKKRVTITAANPAEFRNEYHPHKSLNTHGHTNFLLAKCRFAMTLYELYALSSFE